MPAIRNALVVGGGVAGAAVAVHLARRGIRVDLVEVKPTVTAGGFGVMLQGNALRMLRRLGVWERIREEGYPFDSVGLRAPDAHGSLLGEVAEARSGEPGLPVAVGLHQPQLARILLDRARQVGARIRFGTTCTRLVQDGDGVEVTFAGDWRERFDAVIGADGTRSSTRRMIGIDVRPRPTGMGLWRLCTSRPESVTRSDRYHGGRCHLAGYCPTGQHSAFAYLVEKAQNRNALSPGERLVVVRDLAAGYHGPWDELRERLRDSARVTYTWLESHLLEPPWHRGRVVLIGDAAHTCAPTLPQGVAQALEDADVLAGLLGDREVLDDRLCDEFTARRHPRVKAVVDASVQLDRWLLDPGRGDAPGLLSEISHLVSEPA
jgi:2-polyprenyl-6-methoxyphenol hydroxylase-like FAD-dependent oxidoreductase